MLYFCEVISIDTSIGPEENIIFFYYSEFVNWRSLHIYELYPILKIGTIIGLGKSSLYFYLNSVLIKPGYLIL